MAALDILDLCCGPRMTWQDPRNPRVLYLDKRQGEYPVDTGTPGTKGRAPIKVAPDVVADFQHLPLPDNHFRLVLFDPPHISQNYDNIMIQKYGRLPGDWRSQYRAAFSEAFRVLQPNGILIFKWAESAITLSQVLELTPIQPLFGHRTRKTTHWLTFIKPCPATTQ